MTTKFSPIVYLSGRAGTSLDWDSQSQEKALRGTRHDDRNETPP